MTGADKREQEKKVKEFEETASSGEQKRAKAVAEAIDAYGPRKFLREAVDKRKEIDPLLRAGNADAERDERSRLIDLYNKAKEGDPNAAAALAARTKGTGVGVQIGAAMKGPQSDADKAAEKKLDDEHKATIEAQEDAQERATETAVRALQSRYNRLSASGVQTTTNGIAREIRRTGLPQEQGMLEPTERKLRANFEEMISGRMAEKGISREQAQREFLEEEKAKDKAEAEKRAKPERDAQKATDKADKALEKQLDAAEKINDAMETDSDLRYRLKNTVKPYETGKSMGLDEYESSIKSQSGEDKLERRMHEAVEILKKIQDNNEKIQVIARKAR